MKAVTSSQCRYEKLENGIHRLDILGSSREAVDEFFELRRQIQATANEETILLLTCLKMKRLPSINQMINQTKLFSQQYPQIQPTASAIIYRQGMLVFILNSFLKVFLRSKDDVQFFTEDQENKAIDWLLQH